MLIGILLRLRVYREDLNFHYLKTQADSSESNNADLG